jgi:hypothetical protein
MLLQQKLHNVAAVHVDRIEPGAAVALELLLRDDGRGSGDEERRHQVQVARPPTAGRGTHRPWRHPAISLLKAAKLLPLHSCSRPASLGGTRLRQLARHKTAQVACTIPHPTSKSAPRRQQTSKVAAS